MKRIITAGALILTGATILWAQADLNATSTPMTTPAVRPRPTAGAQPTDPLSRPRPDMSPIAPRAGAPTMAPGGSSSIPGSPGTGTGTGTGGTGTGSSGTGTGSGNSGGTGSGGSESGTGTGTGH